MPVAACPNCGYDTKGLPSNVCPECGQRLPDVAPPQAPNTRWRVVWAALIPVATLGAALATTLLPGVPLWWGPLPVTVIFPMFMLGRPTVLAFAPVALAAAILAIPVLLGRMRVPWWTTLPVGGLVASAWYWFATGMGYGLRYEGGFYVAFCGSVQIAVTVVLAWLWIVARRRRFGAVFAWHLIAAAWLASYAFPYYGEVP